MSSEYGSGSMPTIGTLSGDNDPYEDIRADLSINIGGRRIECHVYKEVSYVTVDGKRFNGDFKQAMAYAASLPTNWNGMFD